MKKYSVGHIRNNYNSLSVFMSVFKKTNSGRIAQTRFNPHIRLYADQRIYALLAGFLLPYSSDITLSTNYIGYFNII